jgi:hypothetical protein
MSHRHLCVVCVFTITLAATIVRALTIALPLLPSTS